MAPSKSQNVKATAAGSTTTVVASYLVASLYTSLLQQHTTLRRWPQNYVCVCFLLLLLQQSGYSFLVLQTSAAATVGLLLWLLGSHYDFSRMTPFQSKVEAFYYYYSSLTLEAGPQLEAADEMSCQLFPLIGYPLLCFILGASLAAWWWPLLASSAFLLASSRPLESLIPAVIVVTPGLKAFLSFP